MPTESVIDRRMKDLRAVIGENFTSGTNELLFIAVSCDSCGFGDMWVEDVALGTPEEHFAGWHLSSTRPYRDLCPQCIDGC